MCDQWKTKQKARGLCQSLLIYLKSYQAGFPPASAQKCLIITDNWTLLLPVLSPKMLNYHTFPTLVCFLLC